VSAGRRAPLAGLVAALAVLVTGCGAGAVEAERDTVVIVTGAQAQSFAQDSNGTGYESAEYLANTNATLLRNPYVDGSGGQARHQDLYRFEPLLAERYEVSPDRLTYTFHLDPDARSTAGNPVTAEDVRWSYERKFATATSIVPFVNAPVIVDPERQIRVLDPMTVSFTVDEPGYGFTLLSLLSNTTAAIYDTTVLKAHVTPEDPYAVEWSASNGNWGYGAYGLESFTPGQQTTYVRNEDYAGGAPPVRRIIQRVVADAGIRANLLAQGDTHVAAQLRPADQAGIAETGAQVFSAPTNAMVYMPLTTTMAPFDDVAVRRALARAVPYEQIVSDVYKGRAEQLAGMLSPGAPGYDGDGLVPFRYDPAESRRILAEAGHTEPVAFTLTVNASVPDLQEAAVQIQTAARDAGFAITIEPVPSAAFNEGLAAKTFQASMGRDYAVVQSPPYELALFYTADSPINWPDWTDARFDTALATGNAAGDPLSVTAGRSWNAAQRRIQSDVPTIWMAYVQPLNAFRGDVGGYVFRTDNTIDYSQLTLEGS
jgi:peptide/nickel transport system substrate-binding protein